jgi:hypothetical protein
VGRGGSPGATVFAPAPVSTGSEPTREGACPDSICANIHTLSMMGSFPTTMP